MVKRALTSTALLALLAGVAVGCSSSNGTSNGKPHVVATTTQAADLTRAVAGTRANVTGMLRPNSDPHEYEPRPSDARALVGARLVVRSGAELDAWLGGLLKNAGGGARQLTLIDSVRRLPGDAGKPDPHWWQDPRNAELAVVAIRDALTAEDPGGRATYEGNARRYLARLRALDAGIRGCIDRIPPARRKLVTSHDALGYFTHAYGIQMVGAVIPSRSSQAQASAGDSARLVATIKREHVPAVFPESSLNPKLERAISREAGARIGGALWADTLGPAGSNGATYIDSMESNTAALVDGFSGGKLHCRPHV
jgi:zinc/manganese transport system substrate-binding protein